MGEMSEMMGSSLIMKTLGPMAKGFRICSEGIITRSASTEE